MRGRFSDLLQIVLFASLFAAPAGRASATGRAPEFMPVEEIRPGMQGTARTVFEGNKLEEFGVEILGVLKNAIGPQQDLIL
ncbi:MAG TPA: peptidase S55 SpoIVB, partial [Candidatus Polarisedimenticolia bacterium]|nr:peptidase S55 SpoIVB [Candidatus Polarisedimenticolia bacterium]